MLFKNTSFLSKSDIKLTRTWFGSNILKMGQNKRSEINLHLFFLVSILSHLFMKFLYDDKKNLTGKVYFHNKITEMDGLGKNSAFPTTLRFFWE